MLNKLRIFSKTKMATVLVGIIIIPFVLWGMGSVFSGGNTNSVAKIDSVNISTKNFVDHINSSNIDANYIKKNIDNNVLQELLAELISQTMLKIEIENLNISISDQSLKNKIIFNKKFLDQDNKFSRLKYEKFLLENNINAPTFETKLKNNELRKKLFSYIDGGIKSPYFLINKTYINENKNIQIDFINLENIYKKEFSDKDINEFIKNNKEQLKKDFIDISYVKIIPNDLIGMNEFNNEFFKKIDEIENLILNGSGISEISKKYKLKVIDEINYINLKENNEQILDEIYLNRNNDKIQLLDKNDYYLIFEIKKITKKIPSIDNKYFIKQVKKNLLYKEKYKYNKNILEQIQSNKFNDGDFKKIGNSKIIKNKEIKSQKENDLFDKNSIKLLYSLKENTFALLSDIKNNIYLVKIKKIQFENISKNADNISDYSTKSKVEIRDTLYTSYDSLINDKYNVKVNEKTLDRVINYFK